MSTNRAKDPKLAREQATKDRGNASTWNTVAEKMENGEAADIMDAWVKAHREKS
jgi:hypothetical protein